MADDDDDDDDELMCGCIFVSAPAGSMQQADDQFLSRIFLFVAFVFIFWLMIA